jgi:membrane protein
VQIFDRSMTPAAQASNSIFPLVIMLGVVFDRGQGASLADVAHLPDASRHVLDEALSQGGISAVGVVGCLLVLLSSTGAVLLLLTDCVVAVIVPRTLLGGAVPTRMLAPGGVIFGVVMLAVPPVGSVYLPRALQTSADRYGTIGVAFTYIGWLYVVPFCLLLAVVFGQVVARDEGPLGRWVRGGGTGAGRPEIMRPG